MIAVVIRIMTLWEKRQIFVESLNFLQKITVLKYCGKSYYL